MKAYIGIGANLGDREATMRRAIELLAGEDVEIVAVSTFRETDPVGYVDQPRFLNGAVELDTNLSPQELLDRLLAVERKLGRSREGPRYGPRTIDLDLLLYGDAVVDDPGLRVPHPHLAERRFALEPLAELDPGLAIPGAGSVSALLAGLE
ncbi:MAG: 2-amino-4-hydroxy-6-hydroxymethyldihydropteridine diphosphokinase [Actinobacteria bacterium]|nr:2-amino-4-hydroxy-6-hydroxymethyldihydropteridine diphosphokinase [Actinomycetota bacterium]